MQRMTRQRAAVLDLLGATDEFRSAQHLHDALGERGESVGIATVYRNLQALVAAGEVDSVRVGEETLYRRCVRDAHHHHLVCRRCGRTVEIEASVVEAWAAQLERDTGFTALEHTLEFVGVCADCRASGAPA